MAYTPYVIITYIHAVLASPTSTHVSFLMMLICIHAHPHTYTPTCIHTCIHTRINPYTVAFPRWSIAELKGQMFFYLGNCNSFCWASPLATHSTLCYSSSKVWLLSNIQQRDICTCIHIHLHAYTYTDLKQIWAQTNSKQRNRLPQEDRLGC